MSNLSYFILYILSINIIGFVIMYVDKQKSIKHLYRISEKTIFLTALAIGAIGVYIGMQKFRHKTKHKFFTVFIPICIFLNIISTWYIIANFLI